MSLTGVFGQRVFYGWAIVAASFLLTFVGFTVVFSFSTYFEPLTLEFRAERSAVAFAFSLLSLLYFGLGAVTGLLADRFGARKLAFAAALIYLAGLVLAARADALWHIYLGYSLLAGLAVAATYVPSLGTVQRWFLRRRALASGIAISGIGAAMVIGPGISNALIAAFGWRSALLLTGIGAAGLVALSGALLVRSPAAAGLTPDGGPAAPPNPAAPPPPAQVDRSPGAAVRSAEFRWLYAAMLLMCIPLTMGHGHIVAFGRDAGLDPALAALGLQAMGAGSIVGRLALAPIADRIGRRRAYASMTALLSVVMVTWLVLPAAIVPLLVLFGLVFGTAQGGFVALSPAVVADYFGTRFVATIIGFVYTAAGLGSLIGPWLAGAIYDATGAYHPAIVVGAACAGLATLALFRIRPAEGARAVPESPQETPASPSATPLTPPDTAAGSMRSGPASSERARAGLTTRQNRV